MEGALNDWSDVMDDEELERIGAAKRRVESALEGESAADLKSAVEDLDGATEVMAARLVERAMAERLERQMGGEN